MVAGGLFIIFGILIALFPNLLQLIISALLIITGVNICAISYSYKKMSRHADNPFIDFIFRI